ncbi:hypothetical protein B296_00026190 [Ensete ventricosum]|uniref:Uncharacterized protein n=1 Tax=Ensete ventricosum TaxID=4639 RepID=A0A427AS04_ENSVE|nr:hypothetical protein B296_00026190 [Ensete ventricosum]
MVNLDMIRGLPRVGGGRSRLAARAIARGRRPRSRKFEQKRWQRRVSKPLAGDRPRKVHTSGRRSKSRTNTSLGMEKRVPSLMRPRARNGSGLLVNTNPSSHRSKSIKDLCLTSAGEGDEG